MPELDTERDVYPYSVSVCHQYDTLKLRMHEVIDTAVDSLTPLSVDLKIDSEALSPSVMDGIKDGSLDLKAPDTTVVLLKLNAVLGLLGKVERVDGKDTNN